MDGNFYHRRELLGLLLTPIILLIVAILGSYFGYIKFNLAELIGTYAVVQLIAGIITFSITYKLAKKLKLDNLMIILLLIFAVLLLILFKTTFSV